MTDEAAARAALRDALPDFDTDAAVFRPLDGGLQRRSWAVELGARQLVLRLSVVGAEGLLDVAVEARAMRAAAAAGLAPAVVALDSETGALVTEYRAGAATWTPEIARTADNVTRAAALLRALHAVPLAGLATVPVYAAEKLVVGYLSSLAGVAPAESRGYVQAWAGELLQLARRYDAAYAPTSLCHNDLAAANVLDDGGLVLVDFEYAVRAAPLLDLAGLAGMNDFGDVQLTALLDAYYRDDAGRVSRFELDRAVRLIRLMAYFWARLAARRATDPQPYVQLAAHLTGFLK